MYNVSGKETKMFFVISSIKPEGDSAKIMYKFFRVNLLQNNISVSHLAWIMPLHYLVKLEMLISHVLPLSCYRKKLQILSHLNCGLQIRQIWILLIRLYSVYILHKKALLIWTNWNRLIATENGVGQAGWRYQLDLNLANLEATVKEG